MRLKGKTALVTGATSGIGAATARMLLQEGAKVIIADIEEAGFETVSSVSPDAASARWLLLDVTNEQHWIAGIELATEAFGKLDVLVNCAGRSSQVEDQSFSTQDWNAIMNVNVFGMFLGAKHIVPLMQRNGGGSIINIASIMALVGGEGGHPAYHASKGAVRALTRTHAVRYGRFGIRVNAVYPGFLPPMRTGRALPAEMVSRFVDSTPLARIGSPHDIAAGVAYLASDESAFVTGAELVIDGGFTCR